MSNNTQSDPNSRGVIGEFTSRAPYWAAGGGALAILANAFRIRNQNLEEVGRAKAVDDRDTIRIVLPGAGDSEVDAEAKKAIEESLQRIIDINTREPEPGEDKTASDTPVSLDLPAAGTTKAKEIAEGTGRGLRVLGSTVWDKTGGKALEAIGDAFSGFVENITPDASTFLAVPAMIAGTAGAGYLGYRGVDRLIRKKEERDLKKRYENIRRQYARSIGEDIELALQEKSAADIEFDSPTHVPILRGMISRISEELQNQDLACDDKVANFTAGQVVMGGMVTAALATLMAGHISDKPRSFAILL